MSRPVIFLSTLLSFTVVLLLAGCGDDSGGTGAPGGGTCMPSRLATPAFPATATTPEMPAMAAVAGQQSVPGMPGDPCPQNNPMCLPPAMGAVTSCGPNGQWLTATGTACDCIKLSCGNGLLDPGETCDPKAAITATCVAMNKGTGIITCDPKTCMFNVSMCSIPLGTGGTGSM